MCVKLDPVNNYLRVSVECSLIFIPNYDLVEIIYKSLASIFHRHNFNYETNGSRISISDDFDAIGGLELGDSDLKKLENFSGPGSNGSGVVLSEKENMRAEKDFSEWAFNNVASLKVKLDSLIFIQL